MSQTEVDRFVRDMKTNTELQAEVKAKGGAIAEIIKIAIARGYSVAAEEVRVRIASQKPILTEEEEDLGHVAGELRRNVGEKAGSRARAIITSHSAAEFPSRRFCRKRGIASRISASLPPCGARRRAGICGVAAPRRCNTSTCVAAPCICPPQERCRRDGARARM